ncbi:unnamed protein product [Symbiodinium sp. CCMP2592]|nr:unnamed protein product [Symbiodinium sp. CCMP2592]
MNAAADETSSREPQDAAASMSSREACLPLGSGEREGNGAGDGSETESPNPKDVWVHVYHCDPYTGFLNRMLLKNSEIGIYHAGIEVYGEEWSFQYFEDTWNDPTISGIIRCAPKQMSGYEYQESLNLGPTSLSEVEVDDLLETLCDEYSAGINTEDLDAAEYAYDKYFSMYALAESPRSSRNRLSFSEGNLLVPTSSIAGC